ncbi:MAG: glutaredoxin family protein [Gammaproteobacteria bacterium]
MISTNPSSAPSPDLALYCSESCWFCARVRQTMRDLGITLELRDIDRDPAHRVALIAGGGTGQVPCLRMEHASGGVGWLYESEDISAYLWHRFNTK